MRQEMWDIPEPGEGLADRVAELGEPLAEFAVSGRRLFLSLVLAPLAFLAGWALIFAVIYFLQRVRAEVVKVLLLGLFLVVSAVLMSLRAYRNRGLRVLVYPEGIVRIQREQVSACFWDEIALVWQKKTSGAWAKVSKGSLVFTVQRAAGGELDFDDYLPEVKRLGEIIQRETLRHLLPAALSRFQQGETVAFDKLRVGREGLSADKEILPWDQVKDVEINDEKLLIHKEGKWLAWYSVPIADVPNVHVFQALVNQVLGDKGTSE